MKDPKKTDATEHNCQIGITRLVFADILVDFGKTESILVMHKTKRDPGGFDTSELTKTIAHKLRMKAIIVAHDDWCKAIESGNCNCSPDIIDHQSGKVLNRGN